jgi:hypothetical protein
MYTKIYVLGLEGGKYYVGSSETPQTRIINHVKNNGSAWTRKYPPQRVIEVIEGDKFDEDKCTKQYMFEYGIENVRGGSYCEVVLSDTCIATIKKELDTVENKCFRCGKSGHFVLQCPQKKVDDVKPLKRTNDSLSKTKPLLVGCSRCGRNNHKVDKCFAKTHVNGGNLSTKKQKLDSGGPNLYYWDSSDSWDSWDSSYSSDYY